MHQACLWQASLCALMRNHLTGGMKGGHSHQAVTIRKVVDITQTTDVPPLDVPKPQSMDPLLGCRNLSGL